MSPHVQSRVDAAERVAVITTDFTHPAATVWTLFSDPAKLVRWWGPPGMPMTVDQHDLRPGGSVVVTVHTPTGPIRGRWHIRTVDAPHHLAFVFASDGLEPTEIDVTIIVTSETSQMTIAARFATDDSLAYAIGIGFVNGVTRSCTAALRLLAGQT